MIHDDKLEEAKKLYQNANADQRYVLERLFPELKESEDEIVRREIRNFIWKYPNKLPERDRWLAWLEKQDERANFLSKIQVGDKVTRNEDGELVNLSQLDRVAKAADKVEPKFNVGDWIVNGWGNPRYVKSIFGKYYELCSCEGFEYAKHMIDVNYGYHLWTFNDTKEGDVLVASDGSIFLFAGVDDCACKYYVALTTDNHVEINKDAKDGYWEVSRAVHPATKEQRDLLFQKMKEAGYELDAENKKLTKEELIKD